MQAIKIETIYTLKQPFSHIGESESTTSFLNTINIAANGKMQEIFALTGNAIRGTLRDCAARYLLDKLNIKLHKNEFNILFSGGNISGSLTTDIDQAKRWRELVPLISIFGAGVGNQILQGKLTQSFALPVCIETQELIPSHIPVKDELFNLGWKEQTGTINFTRFDDTKNINLHQYIENETEEQKKKEKEAATQMRYEVEYYAAGGQLYHLFNFLSENDIEIGVFMSAIYEFSNNPFLGGMAGKGFGMVDAEYMCSSNIYTKIKDGILELAPISKKCLNDYDTFLISNRDDIVEFLKGIEK